MNKNRRSYAKPIQAEAEHRVFEEDRKAAEVKSNLVISTLSFLPNELFGLMAESKLFTPINSKCITNANYQRIGPLLFLELSVSYTVPKRAREKECKKLPFHM